MTEQGIIALFAAFAFYRIGIYVGKKLSAARKHENT